MELSFALTDSIRVKFLVVLSITSALSSSNFVIEDWLAVLQFSSTLLLIALASNPMNEIGSIGFIFPPFSLRKSLIE